jgi:regulator of replication initiation timing
VRAASADAPPFIPSQTSANSGASKRTTFNGQDVVPNSDSDDDSLPDLDFGISAPKVKAVTTTTSTTRSKRMSEDQQNGLRKPIKKAKADKTSFDALVKTAQQNLETERQIQEHKAALERSLEEPVNTTIAINEDVLGQVVDDDDDDDDSGKAHRLFQAMQRTNATQMETTYHFFQDTSDSIQVQPRFPMSCLPDHRWVSNFKGGASIRQH